MFKNLSVAHFRFFQFGKNFMKIFYIFFPAVSYWLERVHKSKTEKCLYGNGHDMLHTLPEV